MRRVAIVLAILVIGAIGRQPNAGTVEQPPLLLLITADTLRADHLGTYGDPNWLTPQLDALAAESLVFEHAYTPAPFTLPAVTALHTGRYPTEVGMVNNLLMLPPGTQTLAESLRRLGYRTAAVVSNFILRRVSGLHAGFDHYDDRFPQVEANRPDYPERIAQFTTDAALEALAQYPPSAKAPVFLWVHYQDPHGPYTPPGNGRARYLAAERNREDGRRTLAISENDHGMGALPRYQVLSGEREVAFYRAGYKAEVHYMDQEIGRLLKTVRTLPAWRGSVVLFSADHGEAMGEEDYWFAHGRRVDDGQVHIPLLIRAPGAKPGRRSDIASLMDLSATLLARAGGAPAPDTRGRDLLAPDAARASSDVYFANLKDDRPRIGLVADGYKYVLDIDPATSTATERLTRLAAEDQDLSKRETARAESMRGRLLALKQNAVASVPAARQEISPEDHSKLRALGYAE